MWTNQDFASGLQGRLHLLAGGKSRRDDPAHRVPHRPRGRPRLWRCEGNHRGLSIWFKKEAAESDGFDMLPIHHLCYRYYVYGKWICVWILVNNIPNLLIPRGVPFLHRNKQSTEIQAILCYAMNVFTACLIGARQTGQSRNAEAHLPHVTRWPQGTKTMLASLS